MTNLRWFRPVIAASVLLALVGAVHIGRLKPAVAQSQSSTPQCLTAGTARFKGRSGGSESFNDIISKQPMRFGELLGRSHSEIMPDEQLHIAEAYRDDEIRYTAFFGLDYCAKSWDFLSKESCISGNSHLVVFFNRGYAFRVQMRFLISQRNPRPPVCEDLAPILRDVVRQLDGSEFRRGDEKYVMSLTGDSGIALNYLVDGAVLEWFLLGAPVERGRLW